MATKWGPLSILAGVFAPSISESSLIFDEAKSMGLSDTKATQVAEVVYREFRSAHLINRWRALMVQDRSTLRSHIETALTRLAAPTEVRSADSLTAAVSRSPSTKVERALERSLAKLERLEASLAEMRVQVAAETLAASAVLPPEPAHEETTVRHTTLKKKTSARRDVKAGNKNALEVSRRRTA